MTKEVIRKGDLKGLRVLTEEQLEKQEKQARKATKIPVQTKTVITRGVFLTPSWCRNGDIERCQAPCGLCLQTAAANPAALKGEQIQQVTVLNFARYLEQKLQAATMVVPAY